MIYMKLSCNLEFTYGSEEEAQAVLKAVEVDNYEFVKTTLEGSKLHSIVESDSIPSLIHTLDDYLACVSVAERVVKGE
ncbi:MAG: KEOPS complex subunit Pcc1 [Promethearchaeota archaeon]|jgi:hypothetical protein